MLKMAVTRGPPGSPAPSSFSWIAAAFGDFMFDLVKIVYDFLVTSTYRIDVPALAVGAAKSRR
jgi:hypothetical protein